MTVTNAGNVTTAVGDGGTSAVPIPFYFLDDAEIEVTARTDATGAEAPWVLNTDYTLTGAGNEAGGTLNPITTRATGTTLFIRRVAPFTQGADFPPAGAIPSAALEQALDKLTFQTQQLDEGLSRALTVPVTDGAASLVLPNAVARAGKALTFDGGGVPTTGAIDDALTAAVASATASAAASASAAAASEAAAAASASAAANSAKTVFMVAITNEIDTVITGTAVITIRMPFAMTLTGVRASLVTASGAGAVTVDIKEGGASVLSTPLTIDAGETTSTTAATPAVISDTALADDAEITFDIVTAGSGAVGLKVTLVGDPV